MKNRIAFFYELGKDTADAITTETLWVTTGGLGPSHFWRFKVGDLIPNFCGQLILFVGDCCRKLIG